MKKVMLTLGAFALVAMMGACGGAKADGESLAKKKCECEKLMNENKTEEFAKCAEEGQKMSDEFEQKYAEDTAAMAEFEEAFTNYKCE
jgi:hypothetical protein